MKLFYNGRSMADTVAVHLIQPFKKYLFNKRPYAFYWFRKVTFCKAELLDPWLSHISVTLNL